MAKFYQNVTSIGDCQQATFSFWFRLKSSDASKFQSGGSLHWLSKNTSKPVTWRNGLELITFGSDPTDSSQTNYSSINLALGDQGASIDIPNYAQPPTHLQIGGNTSSYTLTVWLNGIADSNDLGSDDGCYATQYTSGGQGVRLLAGERMWGHCAYLPGFTFDEWHHVYVGVDLGGSDGVGSFSLHDIPGNQVSGLMDSFTRGKDIEIWFDGGRVTGIYIGAVQVTRSGISPSMTLSAASVTNDMTVTGFPVSIPVPLSTLSFPAPLDIRPATYNPAIQFAYYQVWFNQYIQPTSDNFAKLYRISGGRIFPPTNVLIAQETFGASDIYFMRDKNRKIRFEDNQGSAGNFFVQGSIPRDFKPGPGQ